MNEYKNWPKNEILSETCIPSETSFLVRLNRWRFQKLSETIKAEKPFEKKLARCLDGTANSLFDKGEEGKVVVTAKKN